jgi:hypothetical protein
MPLTKTTNPQTGQTAILVNNQWHIAEREASNPQGQKAYLAGGQWHVDDTPVVPKNNVVDDPFAGDPNIAGPGDTDLLTGAANVMTGLAGQIAGVGHALTLPRKDVLSKDVLSNIANRQQEGAEAFTDKFRVFNSPSSKRGEEMIGHGMDWAAQQAGAGVNAITSGKLMGEEAIPMNPQQEQQFNLEEARSRGLGEFGSNFIPAEAIPAAALRASRARNARLTNPDPVDPVIQRAKEIAKEQGATTITAEHVKAAGLETGEYKYEGGIDYPPPGTSPLDMTPESRPAPMSGMPGIDFPRKEMELAPIDPTLSEPGTRRNRPVAELGEGFQGADPYQSTTRAYNPEAAVQPDDMRGAPQQLGLFGPEPDQIKQPTQMQGAEFTVEGGPKIRPMDDRPYVPQGQDYVQSPQMEMFPKPEGLDADVINFQRAKEQIEYKKELGLFKGDLDKRMSAEVERIQKDVAARDWEYAEGDRIRSNKTGRGYEITAKYVDKKGVAKYLYKSLDGEESGMFTADKMAGGFERMLGPKELEAAVSIKVADAFDVGELLPKNPDFSPKLSKLVERGDFRGAMQHIANESSNPFYRWLSNVVLLDDKFNPKLTVYATVRNTAGDKYAPGTWRPAKGEIAMSRAGLWGGSETVLLHEAIHARLAHLQFLFDQGQPLPANVSKHIQGIKTLYEHVKATLPDADHYGLKNVYEFLAEGLTNPEFQKALEGVHLPRDMFYEKQKAGALSAFKGFIYNILSVLKNIGFSKFDLNAPNALAVFMNESAGALQQVGFDPNAAKVAYGPEGMAWAAQVNAQFDAATPSSTPPKVEKQSVFDYRKELEEKEGKVFADRYAAALYKEYETQWKKDNDPRPRPIGYDITRPHAEFRQDLYRTDGTRRVEDVKGRPFGPAYTMAEHHPILSRTYDHIAVASVERDNLFNKLFRRANVQDVSYNPLLGRITTMQTKKHVDSPDSVSVLMNRLNESEIKTVMDLVNRHQTMNPEYLSDPTMLKANGATTRTVKFFKELERVYKEEMLPEINKIRAERNLEPIPYKQGYMWTHARYGAYQVFSHDSNGRHTYLAGFNNFADAQKVAKYLKEEKGMTVSADVAEYNPRDVSILPTDAYFEAANLLQDPAAKKILTEAAEEAIKRVGVNKYALTRDSKASGYVGSQEIIDSLGAGKAWESVKDSIELQMRQVANYVGSAQASKAIGEMFNDRQLKSDYPHAMEKARFMWDMFRGSPRNLDELLKKWSAYVFSLPGIKHFGGDDKTGHHILNFAGQAFTTVNLAWWNPVFYAANALQNFTVPSRMQQLNAELLGGKGNITEALLAAELHMHLPTEKSKEIFHKAMDNGSLEARFAEALDWAQSDSVIPNSVKFVMGEKVAAFADSYSRGKAYVSFYELAKSAGIDEAKAHSFAARESQGTMVQYDRWARMPFLNKLGPVGDAIAPLTTFSTNMLFRLADYINTKGVDGKRLVAPVATLLGLQLALAGIEGLPFYNDLEDMYLFLNKKWVSLGGEPWMLPSELYAHAGIPSYVQKGIPAALTGVNTAGTFGMGRVAGDIGKATGLEYLGGFVDSFYKNAESAMAGGTMTSQDRFTTAARTQPPLAKEMLRAWFEDKSPLDPANVKQGEKSVYQRNSKEQIAALLTGKQPLAETETRKAMSQGHELEQAAKAARTQAREVFVDDIIHGREVSTFTRRVMERYPEEIFKNIDKDISRRILDMNIPHEQRVILENKANGRAIEFWQKMYANKRTNYENK